MPKSHMSQPQMSGVERAISAGADVAPDGMRTCMVRATGVRKTFGVGAEQTRQVLELSLTVRKGEFLTVFGPNGCGKSTLLNLVAGFLQPDCGELTSDFGPLERIRKCYVWQNYRDALLPWCNVWQNIAFPLKLAGVRRAERHERAIEMMQRFGIHIDPQAHVYRLSGGEQQIVSILRGLIIEPEIMLLDEPFTALDYQFNLVMQDMIMEIWERTGITMMFVSHDLDQAILLADRLVLLSPSPGRVLEVFENRLPRPRTAQMLGAEEHIALKRRILELFQGNAR